MKRFWLVLLSVGLVLVFSALAMAVDVKFSGEFYAAGMYLDKTKLNKTTYRNMAGTNKGVNKGVNKGTNKGVARTINTSANKIINNLETMMGEQAGSENAFNIF